jgi:COP9 signalosome complex subunit 1
MNAFHLPHRHPSPLGHALGRQHSQTLTISRLRYIGKHVETLYADIRSRALIQYFTPYASVKMSLMAGAFSTTVDELQKELAQLIMKKEIKARIDSHNKIVYASHADQEAATYNAALQMGAEYERRTAALLLRADLIRNDICIKAARGMGPPRGDPREED